MSDYAVAHIDEIDEQTDGRCPWRPIRAHFGVMSFGVTTWTARDSGDRLINEHDEPAEEELYLVTTGRAVFELNGDRVEAPSGTFVFAPPGVNRTAYAEESGTTILALGGTPGAAYQPSGWELWAPFFQDYKDGSYAEAADGARIVADGNPGYPGLLYNLACCESLAGRAALAIEHLESAIQLSPTFRDLARDDTDFDPIRGEPGFQALVTVSGE